MKLETIYNNLVDCINNPSELQILADKIKQAIRLETCYKTSTKKRVNAIKRCASKWNDRPALTGYGICDNYKVVTDSYHLIAIYQEDMPLKLVTNDINEAEKVGKENCINAVYPNLKSIIDFDTSNYNTIEIDYDDIETYYKINKKDAENKPYELNGKYYNIKYLKDIIDVLGTDITVYQSCDDEYRPLYLVNDKNEIGLVLGIKKY